MMKLKSYSSNHSAGLSEQPRGILFVALALHILGAILSFNHFQVGGFTDDATYITLARSLAAGKGYVLGNFPTPVPETTFPPGYPFLLAPLAYIWPGSVVPMQLASLVATLISICIFWSIASDRSVITYSRFASGAAVILFAIHPFAVGASSMVMSEATYMMLSLAAIVTTLRLENVKTRRWSVLILLAVLLNLTLAVRTVGFSLTIAVLLFLVIVKRNLREATQLGLWWLIFFLPLLLHNLGSGGGILSSGYVGQTATASTIADKVGQLWSNFSTYASVDLSNLLIPLPHVADFITLALGVTLLFLMLIGISKFTRRGWLILIYLATYFLGVLLFWNPAVGSAQVRFLLPILPFMLLLTVAGLEHSFEYVNGRLHKHVLSRAPYIAMVFVVTMITLLYLGRDAQAIISPLRNRMTDLTVGTMWIATNAPSDAIVASQDPVPMSLYTKRYTIHYPSVPIESFMDALAEANVDYLILGPRLAPERSTDLDDVGRQVASGVIESHPEDFELVFRDISANVSVYERVTR